MSLSAAINNPEVASCLGGTHGGLVRLAVAKHSVSFEVRLHKMTVGGVVMGPALFFSHSRAPWPAL